MEATTTSQRGALFKGLRLKSPREDKIEHQHIQPYQRTSPLRSKSPMGYNTQTAQAFSESQQPPETERENLLRQLQEKEAALEKISENKDRLRMRISNTLGLNPSLQPQIASNLRQQSTLINSISNTSIYAKQPYMTNQYEKRDLTPPDRDTNRKSPLRQLQKNYANDSQKQSLYTNTLTVENNQQNFNTQSVSSHVKMQTECVQQLQLDNTQLQRRLNLVVAELDRMNRDRDQQQQILGSLYKESEYYQKAVEDEQLDDKSANILHEEIYLQRESNKQVERTIVEIDRVRQDAIQKLRLLQSERERRVQNCEDLTQGLHQKQLIMKELEIQIMQCKERTDRVNNQISNMQRKIKDDDRSNGDINQLITRLTYERDELNQRLIQLTETYDNAVRELSRERLQLEAHNKRHIQLLSSKAIFMNLLKMNLTRKQVVVNEIIAYCKFDNNCHKALRQFANVLESCGHYQMKIGLKRWFQNALKPVDTRKQGLILSAAYHRQRLLARMYRRWIQVKWFRNNNSSGKMKAVEMMYKMQQKWTTADLLRSFTQWRDQYKLFAQRQTRLRVILNRQNSNRLREGLENWFSWSKYMHQQMRMHILAKKFAQKHLQLVTFNILKTNIAAKRSWRLMRLAHILKAWKDGLGYRKYMMGQTVSVANMRRVLNQKLLEACFKAIHTNKESQKLEVVFENLQNECVPAIQQLVTDLDALAENSIRQDKLRSLQCLSDKVRSKVQSYFNNWRKVLDRKSVQIEKNLKEMLVAKYKNQLQIAFDQWKKGNHFTKIKIQTSTIVELTSEGSQLSTQLQSLNQKIEFEESIQHKNSRSRLNRACEIWRRRLTRFGLNTWLKKSRKINDKEQSAGFIIQKKRQSICKQAFEIYKSKVRQCRQENLDENRADYYIETRAQRKKRQLFNALCQFVSGYQTQKRNVGIALLNIEIWLKRRAYFKWCDQGNLKREQLLRENQNVQSNTFDNLNQVLGENSNVHKDAQIENLSLKNELKSQASKILSNTFARFYYIKAQRGIQKWQEVIKYQKHLEGLVRFRILQLKKQMLYSWKAACSNFISQQKIRELTQQIRHTQQVTDDTTQQKNFDSENHNQAMSHLQVETKTENDLTDELSGKNNKTIELLVDLNDRNFFQSRLRYLFQQWASYTKRQVRFCKAIDRVISKSIWQNGFTNINAYSQDKRLTRLQDASLKSMRNLFWRKNCGEVIAKWQTNHFKQVTTKILVAKTNISEKTDEHNNTLEEIKLQKCTLVENLFQQQQQTNLIQSWRNAAKWQKTARTQTSRFNDKDRTLQIQIALKKWYERINLTKRTRQRVQMFQKRWQHLKSKFVFNEVKKVLITEINFVKSLANVAFKFDTIAKQSAVQMMKDFAASRLDINSLERRVAAQKTATILHQLFTKKMTQNLSYLKARNMVQKRKGAALCSVMVYWKSRGLREKFLRWRSNAHFETTVIEVNQTGPVVEQVLNHKLEYENYVNFMQDQAYTQNEIDQAVQQADERSKELMLRAVARIKHNTLKDDKYLKPQMFDRWKMWVKIRKLVRYILQNTENKLQPRKADTQSAFKKWKYLVGDSKQTISLKHGKLNGEERSVLIDRNAANNQRLSDLKELTNQGETFTSHLTLQRDELIENLIKSQKLAIVLGRDNKQNAMQRTLSLLSENAHKQQRRQYEDILQRNISLISNLKERIKDFENDNESLAVENEELRQFSLDGYQIAKNVQSLSQERERLSVDLADKSNMIKRLLSENEELSSNLRIHQEHAMALISQSNNNMRRMQQRSVDNY